MKIIPSKINNFLNQPCTLNGALIYGNDSSKIDFYAKKLIANLSGHSLHIMDFTIVNKSPELLLSELVNISIFHKKKLIKLVNISSSISKELMQFIDNNVCNNYIVMVAGELPYNSTTRNYMEHSKLFGIISCYKDNDSHLHKIISDFLEQNCVTYTKDLIDHLQHYFNNSKAPICAELEKLLLYLGTKKELNLADITECFSTLGNSYTTLDNLCTAVANKDMASFIKISDVLINNENFSPVAIIRILSNYFLRLQTVLSLIDNGMDEHNAINQLKPPLFFKQLQNFKCHLKSLSYSELETILECLINSEITCKKINLDSKMLFQHMIFSLFISQDSTEVFMN